MVDKDGSIIVPAAYTASITADPFVEFTYTLAGYTQPVKMQIGETGGYYFPEEVLKETPLLSIKLESETWGSPAYFTYGYYDDKVDQSSYISDIRITDKMT